MPDDDRYWFPAKRYGWGWGFPVRWQGWVVLLLYLGAVMGGVAFLHDRGNPGAFLVYAFVLTAILVAICWWKGEPPRWRWGGD